MRKLAILASIILIFTACVDEREAAFEALHTMEYSRNIQLKAVSKWLNHKDPEIRLRTVETIGAISAIQGDVGPLKTKVDSFQTALANRLRDKDFRVRNAAAFALGELFIPSVVENLKSALEKEQNKETRLKLIRALGKSETAERPPWLMKYIESSDPDLQNAAALAAGVMAYRGHYPLPTVQSIERALAIADSRPEDTWYHTYALYRIGALQSFQTVMLAMGREKYPPETRYFLLKGMEKMAGLVESDEFQKSRSKQGYRELYTAYRSAEFRETLKKYLKDPIWYVRIAAIRTISAIKNTPLLNDLLDLLEDPHMNVRVEALRSLQLQNKWLARREARRIYKEATDWHIRGEALILLAGIQPQEALGHMKTDWMDKTWPEISYAIRALENIEVSEAQRLQREADEATRLLMTLADNGNTAQATTAVEVLVNRSRPPAVAYFLDKLKAGDLAQSTIIANYLSVMNPRPNDAVAPLIEAYGHFIAPRDLEAMEPIISALDSIGSSDAVSFLESQLSNSYPSIREKAASALEKITQKKIAKPQVANEYAMKWDFPALSTDSTYSINFQTNRGSFIIELYSDDAPVTSANFVQLVKNNFYNGIYFHRVVPGFVVQAGDPRGDGWGGTDYTVPCEYNDRSYRRGMVGTAHAGKDSGNSQFFVTHTPQPHLDGKYTLFGEVTSGMDVIDNLMIYDQIQQATLSVTAKQAPVAAAQ